MAGFRGGSAFAMGRDVAEGYCAVTVRTFESLTRTQIEQLSQEMEKLLRELRGEQAPLHDIPAIQKRNRKISRLHNAMMILRNHQQSRSK